MKAFIPLLFIALISSCTSPTAPSETPRPTKQIPRPTPPIHKVPADSIVP